MLHQYEYYYPTTGWNKTLPAKGSTGYFANGVFSTVDIFYSPRHLTFIMVFQDGYVDNKLYWKYLEATKPILPTYAGGKDSDIAQYLTEYSWSAEILLFDLPIPATSYTYGGGMHPGYFGVDDITRGGNMMLVSWTSPTGDNAASAKTGYAIDTATVTWA